VQIAEAGRTVGHGAVQLHGGIGMTIEYVIGHFLRRIVATERSCSATSIITSGGSRTICRCHTDLV
jgi:alkylation response protein AidB-like acyl-CoA dehydrogenase